MTQHLRFQVSPCLTDFLLAPFFSKEQLSAPDKEQNFDFEKSVLVDSSRSPNSYIKRGESTLKGRA